MRPLEPWRFLLLVAVIIAAIPCGIAAASPIWNGADLAVLICLAAFVGVLRIPGRTKTMTVKLSAALPRDFDASGVEVLHRDLVNHPEDRHLLVMIVDTAKKQIDYTAGGEVTPVMGILFVEPIRDADDVATVLDIMQRVQGERTGNDTLDFDFGMDKPTGPVAFGIRTEDAS